MQDEFLKAYEAYSDAIFRYCYFRVYNRERARELSQETFMKAWEYLSRTGKKIDNLRAFLYKIATNLIIDDSRQKGKKTVSLDVLHDEGFDPGEDPTGDLKNLIDNRETLKALEQLDDKYREAVQMRYLNDLSVKEIAHILNDNENNISVKIHRGLSQLRNIVPPNNPNDHV